jgi:hypothetical protein
MGILSKGKTFTGTEQVTSTKLHNLVDAATFDDPADGTTVEVKGTGKLGVVDGGINTAQLADDCITPDKLDGLTGEFGFTALSSITARLIAYAPAAITSSTLSLDLDNGNAQIITLDEPGGAITTVDALANMTAGEQFTIILKPINRTHSITGWHSTWKWFGGSAPAITGTAGSVDIISGISDGTNAYVTMLKGFA